MKPVSIFTTHTSGLVVTLTQAATNQNSKLPSASLVPWVFASTSIPTPNLLRKTAKRRNNFRKTRMDRRVYSTLSPKELNVVKTKNKPRYLSQYSI
jgi:hypothetical protein